jgi:hypothetical protein
MNTQKNGGNQKTIIPDALHYGGYKMKHSLLTGAILRALLISCSPDRTSNSKDAERQSVETALIGFFDAIRDWDYDALEASVTSDFELVEDTLILDIPGFIDLIKPYEERGASITYEFTDFNTKVQGPVAWTRYRNNAVLTLEGEQARFEWLESAVFQKEGDLWKLDRLQSAPVRIE